MFNRYIPLNFRDASYADVLKEHKKTLDAIGDKLLELLTEKSNFKKFKETALSRRRSRLTSVNLFD